MPLARATAALVALAVVIGCGGDEPTAVVRDQAVDITLDDFLIRPQNIAVHVPVGRVEFRIVNRGRLRHSFHLWGENRAPIEIERLAPGASTSASAYLPRGEYRMVCTLSNHAELGMTGRLVVR
jgi:plastocyanin